MDKVRAEIQNGQEAKDIINHPLVRMALDGMREQLKNGFSEQTVYSSEKAHEVWLALRVIEKFEQALKTVIDTGKMAEIELQKQTWAQKTKKAFSR
jgi:hypothetical protein